MADSSYTQILQVFCREFWQDCFVNSVLAEGASYCSRPMKPERHAFPQDCLRQT
jgi:hypothetical protein